jgi:hypothetical protein
VIGWNALIDRGANGTIAGTDMRVIDRTERTIDLCGLDDHTVRNLTIVKAGGVVKTSTGEVVVIMHHCADMTNDSRTIVSVPQLEAFGCIVDDKSKKFSGHTPSITTPCGYVIPITFRQGLPYIRMRRFNDDDWQTLPHIVLTSPHEWKPNALDNVVSDQWYLGSSQTPPFLKDSPFDELGELKQGFMDNLDDDDDEDRRHQAVDRGKITVFLSRIIADELVDPDDDDPYEVHQASSDRAERLRLRKAKIANPNRTATRGDRRHKETHQHSSDSDPLQYQSVSQDPSIPGEEQDDSDTDDVVHLDYNNPAKTMETSAPYLQRPSKRNIGRYARYFPSTNVDTLKKTFEATTQYGTRGAVEGFNLRHRIIAPNPVLSIPRRNEPVATDTLYGSVPAVDDGSTAAQFFIGRRSHYRSVFAMGHTDKEFSTALMDVIRKYGAMDELISDNARAQISEKTKDILRTFNIDDRQSEPHVGNQNFAERGWKDTKAKVNHLLNSKGAPGKAWLLALQYVCEIQNHTAVKSLNWRTPVEWLLGYTPDITTFLQFEFWEPVYYSKYDARFPQDSTELLGRFVGISENVGNAMTFKVLSNEEKVINRAVVRSAMGDGAFVNKRADQQARGDIAKFDITKDSIITVETVEDDDEATIGDTPTSSSPAETFDGEIQQEILRSKRERDIEEGKTLPTVDLESLLGRTFINDPDMLGHQQRAEIVSIEPTDERTADHQVLYRFRSKIGERRYDNLLTYHKMIEWCNRDIHLDGYFEIDGILGHRKDPKANGGYWLKVKWGDGSVTENDLNTTFQDDAVTVSLYAQRNGLLQTPGWKRCKKYAKNPKKLARMINQARLKSHRLKPVYKYGFQVPRNHDEAVRIDERFGNKKWQDAEVLEIQQLFEYKFADDQGLGAPIPEGFQKIPTHFVYDVKHDGRHKARMVAGGHRTQVPIDSVYSGVVSLAGIRIVTFIAEHNGLDLWGTDIGNAYLESYTKEKVAFVAGPEFGALEGHTFLIRKALYGLRSSGARWHDRLYDSLIGMGFTPCKSDPDIWMRPCKDHYEYIACYVDDLLIASKNPQGIIDALMAAPNNYKLKGTGPVNYHLGCDFFRDEDNTMCFGPKAYIERICDQFENMFGTKPRAGYTSPLLSNDHPELDDTELLDDDGIQQYQSLIGALQWAISLGRFDIATAVMSMSSFRVAPRTGHLERLKRICGYLSKMKFGYIRVRTEEPDFSDLPDAHYEWAKTVYGNVKEEVPKDAPIPLGNRVVMTSYVDANLYHDMLSGRSVTGVLHFFNQTPVEWFSKKQATVETATYGSEFVAAKTAVQQIMGLRQTLRYLGIPIEGSTRLFGDNGSVVKGGSIPHSALKKRHHGISYHYTREAVASKAVDFRFIPGYLNPADILSKHWGYQQVWASALRPILFWKGDPSTLLVDPIQPKKTRPTPEPTEDTL